MADKTLVIRGKLHWAKLLGPARKHTGNPKFDKGPYWSVDVTPDEKSLQLLKDFKLTKKLRDPKDSNSDKETRTERFLSLKVLENKKDGTKNSPPKIKDIHDNEWPQNKLLGNETVADVKVSFVDYGETQGLYLKAIRVLKHVPYESDDFEPVSEDDEYFSAPESGEMQQKQDEPVIDTPDGDEDDVPF